MRPDEQRLLVFVVLCSLMALCGFIGYALGAAGVLP